MKTVLSNGIDTDFGSNSKECFYFGLFTEFSGLFWCCPSQRFANCSLKLQFLAVAISQIHLRSVKGYGMITKRHRRWRQPLTKHLDLILEHLERFLRSKGSVNHFSRMTPELMESTLSVMKTISYFNSDYKQWIAENTKNPGRYLKDSESVGVS